MGYFSGTVHKTRKVKRQINTQFSKFIQKTFWAHVIFKSNNYSIRTQKKVLIIKTAKTHICILIIYKLFCVGVCGVIINFINPFKQMPVNTRR